MVQRNKRGLRLDSLSHLLLGGHQAPFWINQCEAKRLGAALATSDPEERMPPDGSSEMDLVHEKPGGGVVWRHHKELMDREDSPSILGCTHWSLLPLERPKCPMG